MEKIDFRPLERADVTLAQSGPYRHHEQRTSEPVQIVEDEFEFFLEEVMEVSLYVFFEIMSVPGGSGYSSGGCGGSNNDLPHRKKDDDDELLRAKRIARAVAKSCPRKVVRRGYGR